MSYAFHIQRQPFAIYTKKLGVETIPFYTIAIRLIAVSGKRQVEVKSLFLRGSGIAAAGVPEHQLCFKFHQILFFSRKLVLTFFGG